MMTRYNPRLLVIWPFTFDYSPNANVFQQVVQLCRNFECKIVVPGLSSIPGEVEGCCEIQRVGSDPSRKGWRKTFLGGVFLHVLRMSEKDRPDVVVAGTDQLSATAGVVASKMLKRPWCWLCWDYPFGSRYHSKTPTARVLLAMREFSLSAAVRDASRVALFYSKGGLEPLRLEDGRLVEIGNGVLFERLAGIASRTTKNPRMIVSLGGVSDDKGAPFLVEVLRRLLDEDDSLRMRFIGAIDSSVEGLIERWMSSGELADKVEFLGNLPFDDAMAAAAEGVVGMCAYQDHDWLRWNQALKVGEYQALGVTVVALDRPGIRELVTDGVDGILVEDSDPGEFASAIAKVLLDDDLRGRLAKAGTLRASKRNWQATGGRLATEIRQVAAEWRA